MSELVIMDTVNVFLKRKSDGHIVAKTKTQMGSISQTVSSEKLYGAIGNQTVAILETQKEVSLTYRNSLWDLEYLSMTQGVAVKDDETVTVKKIENLVVKDNTGTLEVTVSGTPVGNTAVLFDLDGTQDDVAVATKTITIPVGSVAKAGDTVQVVYEESKTGSVVTFDSAKFSELFEIEMSTIAYDPDTMKIAKDVYIQFDLVKPSSAFEMSFENGTALTPEITLEALTPTGSTEMGRIFTVDRIV